MTEPGGPRRGRHSSPDGSFGPGFDLPGGPSRGLPAGDHPGYGAPRYEPARYEPPTWGGELPAYPFDASGRATSDRPTAGSRGVSGLLDRRFQETGPVVEPEWWSYGSSDDPDYPLTSRHSRRDDEPQVHPSAPLPPRPPGVWDRLHPRQDDGDDAQTVAQHLVPGPPLDRSRREGQTSGPVGGWRSDDDENTEAHPLDRGAADGGSWDDETGGLEVIGAHVEEDAPRRGRRRGRRAAREERDDRHDDARHDGDDDLDHTTTAACSSTTRTRSCTTRRPARSSRSSRTTGAPAATAVGAARSPSWSRCWCSAGSSSASSSAGRSCSS